jgi:16S rRNA (cytosine967-C5)-methyltransferase
VAKHIPNSAANLSNRERHLVALWRAYVEHPTARQADKWLAQYFREHKSYGKKDRAWYSEEFFSLLRRAVSFLPEEKTKDAAMVWRELTSLPQHKEKGGLDSLPQTWKGWLQNSSLPAETIPGFLANLDSKPPLYLRANYPEKAGEIESELKAAGYTVTMMPRDRLVTFAVVGQKPIYELASLKSGLVEIQDLASQLLGEAVDAHPGMAVWDVCAGGGGKTMQIASQMKNRGVLYASDIRDYKLDELKLRARRGGFHNVRRFVYDAETQPELTKEIQNSGGFHRILVDAPCSASGTLRRNPDVRYRIMPGDPEKFAALQLKILTAVAPYLRPGGKLIYATCSVFKDENENVVEKFLPGQAGFSLIEAKCVGSPALDSDTMFYAVMERK